MPTPTDKGACTHDPAQFITADEGTSYCPACEREGAQTYEYRAREHGQGWWWVEWRYAAAPGAWEVVARVFGERRAEIVRDALSKEANERV
jgi:hypothetical protein